MPLFHTGGFPADNASLLIFRMYLIKQVPKDARKLEMCFDCNAFQYQLDQKSHPKDHVFQVGTFGAPSPTGLPLTLSRTDHLLEQEAQGHLVYR